MNAEVKIVHYVGGNKEFVNRFEEYCAEFINDKYQFKNYLYEDGAMVKNIIDSKPHLVIVDFTEISLTREILEEILYLKRYEYSKRIAFAAMLGDEQGVSEQTILYASGFQLGFKKGGELESFFSDCLYVGFDDGLVRSDYNRAINLGNKSKSGFCSILNLIYPEKLLIETDYSPSDDKVQFQFPLIDDQDLHYFSVKKFYKSNRDYSTLYSILLNIPYSGPWGTTDNDSIQKDSVETWLDHNQENLEAEKDCCFLVSSGLNLFGELYGANSASVMDKKMFSHLEESKVFNLLEIFRPGLIFFNIDDEENSFEILGGVIVHSKKIENYDPIIVATNCPSTGESLRKLFCFDQIVCSSFELTLDTISMFCKTYVSKQKVINELGVQKIITGVKETAIEIIDDIMITSISENDITFLSDNEIPMYSVIHLKLPVECFVTIVPSYENLNSENGMKHYFGIIHGVEESNLMSLRRFVNQIRIYPDQELTKEFVLSLIDRKPEKEESELIDGPEEEDKAGKVTKDELVRYTKKKVVGASKL